MESKIEKCVSFLKRNGASPQAIDEFKGVFSLYKKKPTNDDITQELLNVSYKYSLCIKTPKNIYYFRHGTDTCNENTSPIEEQAYRRGFAHGMESVIKMLGKTSNIHYIKNYTQKVRAWRMQQAFIIGSMPREHEFDDLVHFLKVALFAEEITAA